MTTYIFQQYRHQRNIRGIMKFENRTTELRIDFFTIFPIHNYESSKAHSHKSINEDTKIFAHSIKDEILNILKQYGFNVKEAKK